MRKALLILLLVIGSTAAAQDEQAPPAQPSAPPSVSFDAPSQPAAPTEDTGAAALTVPTAEPAGEAAAATSAANGTVPPQATTTEAPAATPAPNAAPTSAPASAATTAPAAGSSPVPPHAGIGSAADLAAGVAAPKSHNDLYSIVMAAHWVVQAVMAGLAVAAFATLVILIQKLAEFALAFGKMKQTARVLARSRTLAEAEAATRSQKGPAAQMVQAAQEELAVAAGEPALIAGVRERTHATLVRIDAGAAQKLRIGTGILASVGSLSPFVGLFGTVFGIMNAFLAIAETKTTSLAVVAPGIAEALLATAIGLAAAIPAVLIYNICSRRLAKFRHQLADVAAATERLQSRELDRLVAAQPTTRGA